MSNFRQLLIQEARALLELIEDETIPLEIVKQHFWRYSLDREDRLRKELSDLQFQIRALRIDLVERADAPVRCAYSEDSGNYLEMLTGVPGSLAQEKKYLNKKSHSNNWMIITDPYFLLWDGPNKAFSSERVYTDFIIDFIPRDLKKLELFILPSPNKRIFKKFNDSIRSRGTSVSYWQTTEIHDRTIIRDNNTATLLGTSFGGYGNKLSFVLDIPSKDLEMFMTQLERIKNAGVRL